MRRTLRGPRRGIFSEGWPRSRRDKLSRSLAAVSAQGKRKRKKREDGSVFPLLRKGASLYISGDGRKKEGASRKVLIRLWAAIATREAIRE